MQKFKAIVSENVLNSEFHSKNFSNLNIISKSKIHFENEFQKIEVLAIRIVDIRLILIGTKINSYSSKFSTSISLNEKRIMYA